MLSSVVGQAGANTASALKAVIGCDTVDDISKKRSELVEDGFYKVYTPDSFKKIFECTHESKGHTTIPKEMANGEIRHLIYIWHGDEEVWTSRNLHVSDVSKRTVVTSTLEGSGSEEVHACFLNSVPAMHPLAIQEGMDQGQSPAFSYATPAETSALRIHGFGPHNIHRSAGEAKYLDETLGPRALADGCVTGGDIGGAEQAP
jgi:hypothetical protein